MPTLYATLLATLEQERDAYREMLTICGDIQQAVIQNDVAVLEGLITSQETIWEQIVDINDHADAQIRELGRAHAVPDEQLRLSVLIAKAEQELQDSLWQVRTELDELFTKQAWMNETNQRLITMQLDYTNYMLKELTTEDSVSTTYTNQGVETDEETKSIFQISI